MPDFDLVVSAPSNSPAATMNVVPWTDPPSASRPSRIRSSGGVPHLHYKVTTAGWIRLSAVVNGFFEPVDALLGGRLFTRHAAEYPGTTEPPSATAAGVSAVSEFNLTEDGHYVLVVTRDQGGAILFHVDVQVP